MPPATVRWYGSQSVHVLPLPGLLWRWPSRVHRCQSGYAVVICKLTDVVDPDFDFSAEKCVVLTGTAPVSGANYTAEMQALLTTVYAIPVNVPLLCGSDPQSKSSRNASSPTPLH